VKRKERKRENPLITFKIISEVPSKFQIFVVLSPLPLATFTLCISITKSEQDQGKEDAPCLPLLIIYEIPRVISRSK